MEKKKDENTYRRKINGDADQSTDRVNIVQSAFSKVRKSKAEICNFAPCTIPIVSDVLKVVFMTRLGGNRPAGIQATK